MSTELEGLMKQTLTEVRELRTQVHEIDKNTAVTNVTVRELKLDQAVHREEMLVTRKEVDEIKKDVNKAKGSAVLIILISIVSSIVATIARWKNLF